MRSDNMFTLSIRSAEPCPLSQDVSDDGGRDNLHYIGVLLYNDAAYVQRSSGVLSPLTSVLLYIF
jgi:hypothetical protein